jgi:hypothetical protein
MIECSGLFSFRSENKHPRNFIAFKKLRLIVKKMSMGINALYTASKGDLINTLLSRGSGQNVI